MATKRVRFAPDAAAATAGGDDAPPPPAAKQRRVDEHTAAAGGSEPADLPDSQYDDEDADDKVKYMETPEDIMGEREDYVSKHTLDSDEEEDDKHKKLNMRRVDIGEEKATLEFDGETKITPFNMNDELEEGHFDAMGNFVFNKDDEDVKDAWLDDIDWAKIKKDAGAEWQGDDAAPAPVDGEPEQAAEKAETRLSASERAAVYGRLKAFLKPRESVTAALKRLGGNVSASEMRKLRWAAKKAKEGGEAPAESDVTKLTGLVDQLVANGEFDAYSYTAEKLDFEIGKLPAAANQAATEQRENGGEKAGTSVGGSVEAPAADGADSGVSSGPRWEFKWRNADADHMHGPCSTEQMCHWKDTGYFGDDGVWARKCDTAGQFYNSNRIDFDLYLEG